VSCSESAPRRCASTAIRRRSSSSPAATATSGAVSRPSRGWYATCPSRWWRRRPAAASRVTWPCACGTSACGRSTSPVPVARRGSRSRRCARMPRGATWARSSPAGAFPRPPRGGGCAALAWRSSPAAASAAGSMSPRPWRSAPTPRASRCRCSGPIAKAAWSRRAASSSGWSTGSGPPWCSPARATSRPSGGRRLCWAVGCEIGSPAGPPWRRCMPSSRIPAFYQLSVEERQQRIVDALSLTDDEGDTLVAADALPLDAADIMVENAVATFALPFGVGLNFQINSQDYIVPMVVEEPSVIAAASNAALVARAGGGFVAEADEGAMIGQIQLIRVPDPAGAAERLTAARSQRLAGAAGLTPGLCRRGAGPRDVEVRLVETPRGETMVVLHVMVDTGDAMGANATNSLVEGLAPMVEEIAGGTACLRILSNLADRRRARAPRPVPSAALGPGGPAGARADGLAGEEVAERMLYAYELAWADPYRAATHNKGIMNGIDAVAVATGQDWRGIEAGAHAYACRDGAYRSLTTWTIEDSHLVGTIE